MPRRVLKDSEDLELWIAFLRTRKFPQTVTTSDGRDRSYEQNSTQWLWATEAAQQLGDRTAAEVQQDWKLRHGVPILREGSEAFREKYDKVIRPLPFEEKLAFMDMIDVTSAMSVKQMTAFLDTVQRECLQNGLRLTDPEK